MPAIAEPFITHSKDSPAYWQIGNLWQVVATGVQTDNSFTLLDQVVHSGGGGGPATHIHTQDEGLYVIRGKCTFNTGGHQGKAGTPGTFVAIPGDCEHSLTVDEADTQNLNFYLPAGFEQLLIGISHPAEERQPPPPELITQMLPPKSLSAKLAADYGQDNVLGDPFTDPPDPNKMATRPTPALPFSLSQQMQKRIVLPIGKREVYGQSFPLANKQERATVSSNSTFGRDLFQLLMYTLTPMRFTTSSTEG